jgi:small subunit ribosomal protein S8
MVNDPIADLLTRIRNAQRAHHRSVTVRKSKATKRVLDVLKKEGFIEGYSEVKAPEKKVPGMGTELKFGGIEVVLRYYETGEPLISSIERVSTPGMRVYTEVTKLPKVFSGLGISIVSTSQGVMSDRDARKKGIGGEVLARVG